MPNPLTNRAFWWAAGLLAAGGGALGWYAGHLAESVWVDAATERTQQVATWIAKHPTGVPELLEGLSNSQTSLSAYGEDLQLLAGPERTPLNGDTTGPSLVRGIRNNPFGRRLTDHTLELIVPVAPSGRPFAFLHASVSVAELQAVQWRILTLAGLSTAIGMLVAGWYLTTAERRLRQQRQLVERVLPSSGLPRTGADEMTALEWRLRELPPRFDGLSRQAQGEAALRELVLKTMSEGLVAVDKNFNVIFCNENFVKYSGNRNVQPIGHHILTAVRVPEFLNVLSAAMRDQEPHRIRVELGGKLFEVQASPMSAGESGTLAVLRDITELERLERVRRDFVVNISHELRTPLAAIQGYAETLLEGEIPGGSLERRFLETIQRHATRLSHVATDLATLSEIEAPVSKEPLEPMSLRMVVASALRSLEREAEGRHVILIASEIPNVEVDGQPLRLEQVMVNLLDNAIRFSHDGGEVRIESRLSGGDDVELCVIDTGIGIPSDQTNRIFERFYRVDKARSRETGGTGLGLSIVKHVVEQMHGRISVESTLGKGSRFTLILPLSRYTGSDGTSTERAADPQHAADARSD